MTEPQPQRHMTAMQSLRTFDPARPAGVAALFAASVLPPTLDADARHALEMLGRPLALASGEDALAHARIDQIVFVASGATKLVAHASHGREQIVAFHFAGDLVPVWSESAHTYALCALEPSSLLLFPAQDFLAIARHEPALASELLARSMRALARSREKAIALGRKTAQERVASFLLTMAERIGKRHGSGCAFHLPMSRRDIADSLGLTIETVSRQLGELRQAGLIETSGRAGIHLLDTAALDGLCGHARNP